MKERRADESWFQWRYRTDPEFRKKQKNRSLAYSKENNKKVTKKRKTKYSKKNYTKNKQSKINAVKKWQKKNPDKLKKYRENQKRKYKNRDPSEITKRSRYLKKLRRKKQIVKARRNYEKKHKKERQIASRKHYRKSKKYNIQRMKPRVKVFCPIHPDEKLRKMHYIMNQKRNSGTRITNWYFCRKCNKPYHIKLVTEKVLVYKVIES